MPLEFKDSSDDGFIEVKASGRLKADDYRMFLRDFERVFEDEEKKHSLLFEMEDFHGWNTGALWLDLRFDIEHFDSFERVALVGDKKWERWTGALYRPFTAAEVRYFGSGELAQARKWARYGRLRTDPALESSEKENNRREALNKPMI